MYLFTLKITRILYCVSFGALLYLLERHTVFSCERAVKKDATTEMILSTKQNNEANHIAKLINFLR